jgi:hypothetical protein
MVSQPLVIPKQGSGVQGSADLCLITGDPGSGKSTTAAARAVDLSKIRKPPYIQDPNIHLFANLHLFGLKYMFLPLPKLIEYFNVTLNGLPIDDPKAIPLIGYGIYIYDEGYQGANARESSSSDTKIHQSLALQSRKRHLKIIYVVQHPKLLAWELPYFANERMHCSRVNDTTPIIDIETKKKGMPKRSFSYDGSKYWPYFRSDELHPMADSRLAKAMQRAM